MNSFFLPVFILGFLTSTHLSAASIHQAAKNGHTQVIYNEMRRDISPDLLDEKGFSPLFYAILFKQPTSVNALVSSGASLTLTASFSQEDLIDVGIPSITRFLRIVDASPLHLAALLGSKPMIENILKAGDYAEQLLNARSHIYFESHFISEANPYHFAIIGNHKEVMEELVKHCSVLSIMPCLLDNEIISVPELAVISGLSERVRNPRFQIPTLSRKTYVGLAICALGSALGAYCWSGT